MKTIYTHESIYLLRFDRGEEVVEQLRQFCENRGIHAGSFTGLGAAETVTLADYDLEKKEYRIKNFEEILEIASLTGNVALDGDAIIIHAHGVFSTLKKVHAGHVMKLMAAGTCEITLTALSGEIRRTYDETTGLKLLK